MMNGHARDVSSNLAPASAGLSNASRLRGTEVMLAASVRSPSVTTAMT